MTTMGYRMSFFFDRAIGRTGIASISTHRGQGNGASYGCDLSMDGRAIAFYSDATNFLIGQFNSSIYIHDRLIARTTSPVNNLLGKLPNGGGYGPSISEHGDFISFDSGAIDLVPNDENFKRDIFIHNRKGISLVRKGACPGNMELEVTGGSIGHNLAFFYGTSGRFTKPNPPGAEIHLGISNPTWIGKYRTSPRGFASAYFFAPSGVCGLVVQGVDIFTGKVTNLIEL